jgi:hypothetical protein
MRIFRTVLCLLTLIAAGSSAALAWHIEGYVRCDGNQSGTLDGLDLGLANVTVNVVNIGGGFAASTTTDASGHYYVKLLDVPDNYRISLDPVTLAADATVVIPAGGELVFATDNSTFEVFVDFLIDSSTCQEGQCWMTGGGTQWESLTNSFLADKGNKVTFGGNVHPGCSATAGAGGDWNHLDRVNKLHFHGTTIPTVTCGNIPNYPPGSTSPKTPFNFIEYRGTGWVKGLQGNKADYPLVYFYARVEDRNEPGSNGAKDGSNIDRYFLRVYTNPLNPTGSTLILLEDVPGGSDLDATPIGTGNLQIHVSSCDNPPLQ